MVIRTPLEVDVGIDIHARTTHVACATVPTARTDVRPVVPRRWGPSTLVVTVEGSDVGTVVVGVDGSAQSRAALAWAADEARLRGATLRVAYVYEYTPAWQMYGYGFTTPLVPDRSVDEERAAAAQRAQDLVQSVAQQVDTRGLTVEALSHEERRPAKGLVELARDAELLVVGSRGRGGFAGLLLGSVSQQCVQHAECPVVVLPPVEEDDEEGEETW